VQWQNEPKPRVQQLEEIRFVQFAND
jgi:hypothetical protein